MQLVSIRYRPERISAEDIALLARYARIVFALTLDVPSNEAAKLAPGDFSVWTHPERVGDFLNYDVEIVARTSYFPERSENLEERERAAAEITREFLNGMGLSEATASQWIELVDAAYGEI